MPSRLHTALFSEPSGRPHSFVMGTGALVLSSLAVYGYAFHDSVLTGTMVMAVGFALSGIAESLPVERQRTAGGLRITAILLLLCLVGVVVFAPEHVV
jgi:hypothetical protein